MNENNFKKKNIWKAAQDGDLENLKYWIEIEKKPIDLRDEDQRTPLHWSASTGKENVVIYCITKGAEVDAEDESKWTPLISSCSSGHLSIVKQLISTKKININKKNDSGKTALFYACSKGFDDIVEYLLQNGAQVNISG
jgi:26S proteasome non-ATPase regulatory subunit 10